MSREIKFRAWDSLLKEMMAADKLAITIRDGKLSYLSYKPDANTELTSLGRYLDTKRYHLMQCTGLKDKNGKEIYEGDIVRAQSNFCSNCEEPTKFEHYVIEYSSECADMCGFVYARKNGSLHCNPKKETFEVIGNIYENLELLNG